MYLKPLLVLALFINPEVLSCAKCEDVHYEKWNGDLTQLLKTFTIHKRKQPLNDDSPFTAFNSYNSTFYVTREDNRPARNNGRLWNFELELAPRELSLTYYRHESAEACDLFCIPHLEGWLYFKMVYCDHSEQEYRSASDKKIIELSTHKVILALRVGKWPPKAIDGLVTAIKTGKMLKIRGQLDMELRGTTEEELLHNTEADGLRFFIDSIHYIN